MPKQAQKWFDDSPILQKQEANRHAFNLHHILRALVEEKTELFLKKPEVLDVVRSKAYYHLCDDFIDILENFITNDLMDELMDTTDWDEDFENDIRSYAKEENLHPHNTVVIARCVAYAVGNLPEIGYTSHDKRPVDLEYLDNLEEYWNEVLVAKLERKSNRDYYY